MASSEEANKSGLGRRLLDGLSLIAGLIAVFQFVVSDNVSSQWFKSARDWLANALNLTDELEAFSGAWNSIVRWVFPTVVMFDEAPLWRVISTVVVCTAMTFLLGLLIPEIVRQFKPSFDDIAIMIGALALYGGIPVMSFSIGGAPGWAWALIGASFLVSLVKGVITEIHGAAREHRRTPPRRRYERDDNDDFWHNDPPSSL
ncbi:hypothetical protein ABT294_28365 [Nonomuraea sp. NPDC000554]|uniref:hypothetical protein n=1 Tax=Nonomuraea sp. NPDC000554 TaxID=3154259 RepID=UPI003321C8F6